LARRILVLLAALVVAEASAPDLAAGANAAFPDIANFNSLVITHARAGCFGSCPTYRLEIHGDGTVLYNGVAFVTVLGEHRSRISPDTVRALLLRFRRADFFSLRDVYSADTDCDSAAVAIAFDGHRKSVENQCAASGVVSQLEYAIVRAANIQAWIKKPAPGQRTPN